jgi:hypothetical protein
LVTLSVRNNTLREPEWGEAQQGARALCERKEALIRTVLTDGAARVARRKTVAMTVRGVSGETDLPSAAGRLRTPAHRMQRQ